MTTAQTLTLTAGLAGAIALGVWAAPRVMTPDTRSDAETMVGATAEPSAPAVVTRPSPRHAAAVNRVAAISPFAPELHDRLKPVLNRGTRVEIAAEGFRSAEQFATVAYAARNTDVPFMVLKHRVLEEGKTLAQAIRESKPGINAAAEVVKARAEARQELSTLVS